MEKNQKRGEKGERNAYFRDNNARKCSAGERRPSYRGRLRLPIQDPSDRGPYKREHSQSEGKINQLVGISDY
jgi:hypothetical protein